MARNKQQQNKTVAQPAAPSQAPKMNFDTWWATVEKKVPSQHRKEIVAADFKSRGLSANETSSSFCQALAMYGVKL